MSITAERKAEVIKTNANKAGDTGSSLATRWSVPSSCHRRLRHRGRGLGLADLGQAHRGVAQDASSSARVIRSRSVTIPSSVLLVSMTSTLPQLARVMTQAAE